MGQSRHYQDKENTMRLKLQGLKEYADSQKKYGAERRRLKIAYVVPVSWGGVLQYAASLANSVAEYADVVVIKPSDSNTGLFQRAGTIIELFKEIGYHKDSGLGNYFSLRNIKAFLSFQIYIHMPVFLSVCLE